MKCVLIITVSYKLSTLSIFKIHEHFTQQIRKQSYNQSTDVHGKSIRNPPVQYLLLKGPACPRSVSRWRWRDTGGTPRTPPQKQPDCLYLKSRYDNLSTINCCHVCRGSYPLLRGQWCPCVQGEIFHW